MPRASRHLEVNSFIRGLITEASPLTFPDNASLDERNFVLNIDGSRDRRLGVDYETDYQELTSAQPIPATGELAFSTFNWENAGGDPEEELVVVQIGNRLSFFDSLSDPLSSGQVGSDFEVGAGAKSYSYASIDGDLVVATGDGDIQIFSYDGATITNTTARIRTRDQWGVEDVYESQDLYDPKYLTVRPRGPNGANPDNITDEHLYNLRNQSWGVPRLSGTDRTSSRDPLVIFEADLFDYPSNADVVHGGVLTDPNDTSDPPRERLFPYKIEEVDSNSEAPKGFFIIDALNRSASREEAYEIQCGTAIIGNNSLQLGSLPQDATPGGASCVAEFAGRVFYGGFSGELTGGDNNSPRLSSYIFFSRLVKHTRDITLCYQSGDPTDRDEPDVIATDGGFIRLQGAHGIRRIENVGNALVVLADNGVWLIRGEAGVGFSATAYESVKLTDRGCVSPDSVVVVDNSLLYWSEDGIYSIEPNSVQDYVATNVTHTTISGFYDNITEDEKRTVKGFFDSFDRRATWIYNNNLNTTTDVKVLTLDVRLGAFYPYDIAQPSGGQYPKMVAAVQVPPYISGTTVDNVVVNGDQVQAALEDVQVSSSVRDASLRELKFLTITGTNVSDQPMYTFSSYSNQNFLDWETFDGTGTDAAAYLITGYLTGGDSSREKFVPNIYFHFKRTEEGFEIVDGDVVATKPSSCLVQARWDWANSANSNRWGREFQAYRYTRHYIPELITDPYDSGFETLVTRNRLRGKGQALSMKISSEAGKDLRILGWGQEVLVERNV